MKSKYIRPWLCFCATAFACLLPSSHACAGELEAMKRVFDREWSEIDAAYEADRAAAGERYSEDLQDILRHMEREGDEYGARPAKVEIMRFAREKTVPGESDVGTPELLKTARSRYRDALADADRLRSGKREKLADMYVSHLVKLEARFEAESSKAAVQYVKEEMKRVSVMLGNDEGAGSDAMGLTLAKTYANGLSLVYLTAFAKDKSIPDLSGRRQHGQLIGTRASKTDEGALEFTEYQDVLELKPLRLASWWTMVIEADFPLAGKGKPRVLASDGFKQDHIQVDGGGILGVAPGSFVGSGYNVNELKGWQRISVIAIGNKTVFYVGGKEVGAVDAVCREPLQALGNSSGSGYPWGGAIRAVMVWTRALTHEEITGLPEKLTPK